MYLRLGNTQIKYNSTQDDFIVLAEVITDATMGYESPVLVHSLEELDIWFGKEFKDRNYFAELLNNNPDLTLYLSRPISNVSTEINSEDYYDLDNFTIDPGIYYASDMFPTEGKCGVKYRVVKDVSGEVYEDYIWTGYYYIPVKNLPQENISDDSISYLNRDTLRIGWRVEEGKKEPEWGISHPGVKEIDIEELEGNPYPEFEWGIDEDKIETREETLAFDFILPSTESFNTSGNYILLGDVVLYTGYSIPISNSYYNYSLRVSSQEMFIQAIKGELIPPTQEECTDVNKSEDERERLIQQRETYLAINERKWGWEEEDGRIIIWKTSPTAVTYFYQWPGVDLEPNFKKTQEIISSKLIPVISFWSKTIGRCKEEDWDSDNIHIQIEKVETNPGYWRATITRYDYLEVFEGTITPSQERLDFLIEKYSKLVHSYIPDSITESLTELPVGHYQLRGAVAKEKGTMEKKLTGTLEMMFKLEDKDYFPDFILIPDPEVWMNEGNYKTIYGEWLEIATTYSLQFLIQNTSETLPWNYTEDKENRLVWFWQGMRIGGQERPGYYLFLTGLLLDQYSTTAKYITYNLPTNDPYSENIDSLETQLIKQKSNYLVCNNQMYYYKEYQNGNNPETTLFMRFTMGKITRELEKNVGMYLGEQIIGRMMASVRSILDRIKKRFTIIRSIDISSYDVNYQEQTVNMVIDTTISDLAQNSMSLDVVINYNKK